MIVSSILETSAFSEIFVSSVVSKFGVNTAHAVVNNKSSLLTLNSINPSLVYFIAFSSKVFTICLILTESPYNSFGILLS